MNKNLLKAYETDASRFKGKVGNVEFPKTIEELCDIVKEKKGIVPRGAGTGFSGGAVPVSKEDTVVDLSKLNEITNLDIERETVEVGCGVVIEELNLFLKPFGYEFPVDILSKRVATIGGSIACNSMGRRSIKYGRISSLVKFVDVVDYMGAVSRKGVTEMSDYVGMEGTTGIIVKASVKIVPIPHRVAELLFYSKFSDVLLNVQKLKRDSRVSMIEFFDSKVSNLLGFGDGYHLFVEYEEVIKEEVIEEGKNKINQSLIFSGENYDKLIKRIDSVYSVLALEGYTRIEDAKVISDKWGEVYSFLYKNKIPTFGSISVGLIHPCFDPHLEQFVPEFIKLVKRQSGRISGSFGLGLLKKGFVDVNDKKILVNIKKRTDPLNKFNYGKVI